MSYFKIHLPAILAAVVVFGNQVVPLLPTAWANLVAAILGLIAVYNTGKVISVARAAGVKGV